MEEPEKCAGPADSPVEAVAAEFLQQKSAGGDPDPSRFREGLATDAMREEFDEVLALAETASRVFPLAHDSGRVLNGRYRLLREIGSGAMGKVWVADDEQLDQRVAIKELNLLGVDALEAEPIVEEESRLLAKLNHPNIAGLRELGADGGVRYLVMELVRGRSLATLIDLLRDTRPRTGRALAEVVGQPGGPGRADLIDEGSWYRTVAAVMVAALGALEAAHGQGVLHGDLEPSNIMLTAGGHPVLLDFGIGGALQRTPSVVRSQLYGAAGYLAPEQVDAPGVGAATSTDVYQMGVVLYEFATLRRAFSGPDAAAISRRVQRGELARPRKVDPRMPAELEDICLMAMERSLAQRYGSAMAMRADLESYLADLVPEASRRRSSRGVLRRLCAFVRGKTRRR